MFRQGFSVAVLLIVGVFAGCIQAESSGPSTETKTGPASFDESSGGIDGLVTDTELQPVAGVLVGILPNELLPQGASTSSDASGHFALSLVPPGKYTLQASALGYDAASKIVEVSAGQLTTVSLIVDKLASEDPFSETQVITGTLGGLGWRVTPECMYFTDSIPVHTEYNTLAKTCGGLGGGDFEWPFFEEEFQKEKDWKTLVAELIWTPQSALTGRAVSMDVNAPNITRGNGGSIDQTSPYTWDTESGKPPIITRIDLPTTLEERGIPESDWYSYPDGEGCTAPTTGGNENCVWFIRLFAAPCDLGSNLGDCDSAPVDIGAPQDLPVTLYFSIFYRNPADPSFTGLPDG